MSTQKVAGICPLYKRQIIFYTKKTWFFIIFFYTKIDM